MSEQKWTARPWLISDSGYGFIRGENGEAIAAVYGDDPDCNMEARMAANCALIAAAPDLYETLAEIAAFAVGHGDVCEIIAKRARAAMTKARGEA